MNLRTRLFLWIGSIFLVFFIFAYFVENLEIRKNLSIAESRISNEIREERKENDRHSEEFLSVVMSDYLGEIDALLYQIEKTPDLRGKFSPTAENEKEMTWSASAQILLENRWINFLQHTIDGKVSSIVAPNPKDLQNVSRYWIDEEISWIFDQESAYIAFHLPDLNNQMSDQSNDYYFFDWEMLLEKRQYFHQVLDRFKSATDGLEKLTENVRTSLAKVLAYLQANQGQLKGKSSSEIKEWLIQQKNRRPRSWKSSIKKKQIYQDKTIGSSQEIKNDFKDSFQQNVDQDRVINMLWKLVFLLETDYFGKSPLDPKAPVGVAKIENHQMNGKAIFSKKVFFNHKLFEDAHFFQSNKTEKSTPISPSMALIYRNEGKKLYLGNTLELKGQQMDAYLTVGLNINHLVQRTALSRNEHVALTYANKVISLSDENGILLKFPKFLETALLGGLGEKMGTFSLEGKQYFYSNLQPFPSIRLHFFAFEIEKEAFWFIRELKKTTQFVVDHISYSMRIVAIGALFIALIILHFLARKIVRPIVMISKASEQVAEGKFEEVKLPDIPESRHDEVVTLHHSFIKMVKGLKEREKVRGVLNKVVSKQIAEEILKGEVHLGGEERELTIFFADIRSFTKLTEKMKPHEVIEMLNDCMTRVTKVIDEMEGVIDKYVGDEVMALFGAPIAREDHALRAIQAAVKIRDEFKVYNEERKSKNLPEVHLGFGIHTGMAVAGNMGAENRLNYTVLGANVNLASRLCSYAAPDQILISQNSLESKSTKDAIEVKSLEAHQFKGFSKESKVYEVLKTR